MHEPPIHPISRNVMWLIPVGFFALFLLFPILETSRAVHVTGTSAVAQGSASHCIRIITLSVPIRELRIRPTPTK